MSKQRLSFILSGHDAVLFNLDLVLLAHCGYKLKGGGGCLGSEALDDV